MNRTAATTTIVMLKRLTLVLVALAISLASPPPALAAKKLDGRWILTVTIPESPNSGNERTYTVDLDVSPRGESLHGRLTITDAEGHTVAGAWRQAGKKVSITYELPCVGDAPCASLILMAKIKNSGSRLKAGRVIVMWDTPNDQNSALYDTSKGSFSGTRTQ